MKLTKQQSEAALHNGSKVIYAGAGSGKTSTIIYDALNKVETGITSEERILFITHTNTAAKELKERFCKRGVNGIDSRTIHSLMLSIKPFPFSEKTYKKIGENDSETTNDGITGENVNSILTDEQVKKVTSIDFINRAIYLEVKDILSNEESMFEDESISKDELIQEYSCDLSSIAGSKIEQVISLYRLESSKYLEVFKKELTKASKVISDKLINIHRVIRYQLSASRIVKRYQHLKKNMYDYHYYDFDDILIWGRDKLIRNKSLLTEYDYIYVDEYQDVDKVQNDIIDLLHNRGINIVIVGDPKQSIYGFKGAQVDFILDKIRDEQYNTFYLDMNFRSTPEIVNYANTVGNTSDLSRSMIPALNTLDGDGVYRSKYDYKYQWFKLMKDLVNRVDNSCYNGVKPSEISLLKHSWDSYTLREIRISLLKKGILSKYTKGKEWFSGHFSSLIANCIEYVFPIKSVGKGNIDDFILNNIKFIRGISDKKALSIIGENDTGLFEDSPYSRFEAWVLSKQRHSQKTIGIYSKMLLKICYLIQNVESSDFNNIYEFVEFLTTSTKVLYEKEQLSLSSLCSHEKLKYQDEEQSVNEWYYLMEYMINEFGDFKDYSLLIEKINSNDCVTISTIHASKGLEWDVVHLIKGENFYDDPEIERLNYVGITRAKNVLFEYNPK
jgi:superfamily I DNA/RNA helicase